MNLSGRDKETMPAVASEKKTESTKQWEFSPGNLGGRKSKLASRDQAGNNPCEKGYRKFSVYVIFAAASPYENSVLKFPSGSDGKYRLYNL